MNLLNSNKKLQPIKTVPPPPQIFNDVSLSVIRDGCDNGADGYSFVTLRGHHNLSSFQCRWVGRWLHPRGH